MLYNTIITDWDRNYEVMTWCQLFEWTKVWLDGGIYHTIDDSIEMRDGLNDEIKALEVAMEDIVNVLNPVELDEEDLI